MDYLDDLALELLTYIFLFYSRSLVIKAPESPLGLFCFGVASSYFCRYALPLRYNPSNVFTSEFTRRRLKYAKDSGEPLDRHDKADMYGLEHVFMNLDLRPKTLWENVGYWKEAGGSFPRACRDLFEEMLKVSGALDNDGRCAILELGCGCAEGVLHILSSRPQKVASYIGININGIQAHLCKERLEEWKASRPRSSTSTLPQPLAVFRADAASPKSWSTDLVESLNETMAVHDMGASKHSPSRNWVVAVDCLYHFRTGREAILTHTCKHYGASLVATDYIQPEGMSLTQRFLLCAFLDAIQVPWSNRSTKKEYIDMLVRCGYEKESLQIIDITDHVWGDYANFLKVQANRWNEIGGSAAAIRPFVHFGWVMRYFAWAGTLRQIIVVAHPKSQLD